MTECEHTYDEYGKCFECDATQCYTVAMAFIKSLILGDDSDLDEDDAEPLADFLASLPSGAKFHYDDREEAGEFICAICGLTADCVTLTVTS